jgi:hypothetical protein
MPSYLCGGTVSMTAAKVTCAVFYTSIDGAGVVQRRSKRANHNSRIHGGQGPAARHGVIECGNQLLCRKHQRKIAACNRRVWQVLAAVPAWGRIG